MRKIFTIFWLFLLALLTVPLSLSHCTPYVFSVPIIILRIFSMATYFLSSPLPQPPRITVLVLVVCGFFGFFFWCQFLVFNIIVIIAVLLYFSLVSIVSCYVIFICILLKGCKISHSLNKYLSGYCVSYTKNEQELNTPSAHTEVLISGKTSC